MKKTNELLKRLKDLGYDSMEEFENDKELHKAYLNSDAPALYVGTYAKYNSGSLSGMWVDLTTFDETIWNKPGYDDTRSV